MLPRCYVSEDINIEDGSYKLSLVMIKAKVVPNSRKIVTEQGSVQCPTTRAIYGMTFQVIRDFFPFTSTSTTKYHISIILTK